MGLTTIRMPQLGESVTEGTVDHWLKKEGDFVRRDELLVAVVTDKVNAEIPSPFEGRLVKILVSEGTTIAIGTEIAQIEVEGLESQEPNANAFVAFEVSGGLPAQQVGSALELLARQPGLPQLSPAVRRLAEENGIDLSRLSGTGIGGRVTRKDILAYLAARSTQTAPTDSNVPSVPPRTFAPQTVASLGARDELVRVGAVRKQIAENMVRSVSTIPHAWALREVDMSALVSYRDEHKGEFRERYGFSLSYVPFVIQVVCDALMENPYLNSTWTDEGIVLRHYVNLGIAVALPDALIVPVIQGADQMGLIDLAHAVNDLATRARGHALRLEDVQGGTFTLNNTGAIRSIAGMSIINYPQAAILSTEAIVPRPVALDRIVTVRDMMNLTMSFDHRIIDGLQAGRFLDRVQEGLETWTPASIRV